MAAPEYLTLLKKSALLSPAQWTVALEVSSRHDSSDAMSAELVRLGLLTTWQAAQLLKGQTGFVLQHYRLLEAIGRGGMGHVFKAMDSRDSSIVAIKVMSRKLSANPHLVNRFKREIRASSLLNSPHIVRTLDAGRVGKVDFMVMEYVNGDQLDGILARIPLMPIAMACEVIRQAALGLQHAHEQKMVHRDIKPGNLMVDWTGDGTGVIKIMDMGLVRLSEDPEERTAVTRAGQVMGTPDYMSPEQGWNTAAVDIRSDIYSLGCTFFRLLTTRVPFPGDNPLQVLMARCSRDAPLASSIRSEIPEPIDLIVQKMTLRDPESRFQTPEEVAEVLKPFSAAITIEGLRKRAREAGIDDVVPLQSASRPDTSDPQDAGYQQFLKEMDTGAEVDLMMASPSSGSQFLTPALPIITPRHTSLADRRLSDSSTNLRTRKTALLAILAMAAVVVLIGFVALLSKPTRPTPANAEKAVEKAPITPEAVLATSPPVKLRAGEKLEFQPTFDGPPPALPAKGQLLWKLGGEAPQQVLIDRDSGKVQWTIPETLASAAYVIPVELYFEHDGHSTLVASTNIVASVQSESPVYVFSQVGPARIKPGHQFSWTPEVSPKPDPKSGLQFRMAGKNPPDMTIDPQDGTLQWTPRFNDLGRYPVTLELINANEKTALTRITRVLLVLPEPLRFELPILPEQTVQAGEKLRVEIFKVPPPFLGRLLDLRIRKENAPAGVALENRGAVLTWSVPKDASGRVELTLDAVPLFPEVWLNGNSPPQCRIVINVLPASGKKSGSVPDAAEVARAEQELRELYKRDLTSLPKRTALAKKLIERTYEQDPGAADFALLKIVIESENKNRIADNIIEALELRSLRYGVSELEEAVAIARDLKTATLTPLQQDRLIEQCLRLASESAALQKWSDTVILLRIPAELLRKTSKGSITELLSSDVGNAASLAKDLEAGGNAADAVRSQELAEILKRWQFLPAFRNPGGLAYASTNSKDKLPDNGKGLWTFQSDRILLKSNAKDASVGFVDPTFDSARWMLRMQVQGSSQSLMVMLGANSSTDLKSHLLTLDQSAFGRVSIVPDRAIILQGNASANLPREGWNDFEVLVDGTSLKVRVNGEQVVQGNLPALKSGQAGILASLQQAAGDTVLQFRKPRWLRLPSRPDR